METRPSGFSQKDGVNVYFQAIMVNVLLQAAITIILMAVSSQHILQIDWVSILFSLVIECGYIAVVVVYCQRRARRPDYGVRAVKSYGYAVSAVTAVFTIVCFYLTASAFQVLLDKIGYVSQGGISLDSTAAKILGIIVMCIVAPVAEELVFRGALLSGLVKRYKKPAAILLCALAFSLMHMNPEQTIYQFLLGAVLSVIVIECGSVIPAIIIHAVSNLIAVLLDIVPQFNAALTSAMEYLLVTPWLFALLAIVLFGVGIAVTIFSARVMKKSALPLKPPFFSKAFEAKTARFASNQNLNGAPAQETGKDSQTVINDSVQGSPLEGNRHAFGDNIMNGGLKPNTLFLIAIGICVFMWLSVFVMSVFTFAFLV